MVKFNELNYGFGIETKTYSNPDWVINGRLYKYNYSNENSISYATESYSSPQIAIAGSTYTFKFVQSPNNSGHLIQYRTNLNNGWTTTGVQLSNSADQTLITDGNVRKEFSVSGPSPATGFYYRMRSYEYMPAYVGNFYSSGTTGTNKSIQTSLQDINIIYSLLISGTGYQFTEIGKATSSS